MILSDEELELRLQSNLNLCKIDADENKESHPDNVTQIVLPEKPHRNVENIPPLVRQLLAITANSSDETNNSIADTFGVSGSSVAKIGRGIVSHTVDPELKSIADRARAEHEEDAHNLAIDNLLSTLEFLKPKLETVDSPKNLAKIAVDMSRVVNTLHNAKRPENSDTKPLVIIHSVHTKAEKVYDVIDV